MTFTLMNFAFNIIRTSARTLALVAFI
jgi:hypothetical protein